MPKPTEQIKIDAAAATPEVTSRITAILNAKAGKPTERQFYRIRRPVEDFRVEKREGTDLPVLVGHAAVFNTKIDFGWFTEEIAPGAFTDTLARKDDVRALFNHDPNQLLGRTKSGTLELEEDDKGLFSRISPPDTQLGRDIVTLIGRGDISQMSFGFWIDKEEITQEKGKPWHSVITRVTLFDVSPVTYPAYETTDIDIERCVRSRSERLRAAINDAARAEWEYRNRELEILLSE